METTIIDGSALARRVKEEIAREISRRGLDICLAVIIVGENPASQIYVRNKKKDCAECGIRSEEYALPAETSEPELLALVDRLNADPAVNGILVQLPLPVHICESHVLERISPLKDVDCFHPYNVGRLLTDGGVLQPCTPAGVMRMLDEYGIQIEGKRCVVLGRSNIVGKPMAMLLLQRGGTVTVCHSKTQDMAELTRQADILVSAVGKTGLVTADMVKEGAAVVDVAMNRNEQGKLCGDVLFDQLMGKAAFLTPVPGGVGPMTRAMLMSNTLKAAEMQRTNPQT